MSEYRKLRQEIEAENLRKQKVKMITTAISETNPSNLFDCYKIYNKIFPERKESYFRTWYQNNYESMPDNMKFDVNSKLE